MARLNISPSELRSRASELESQRQQHLQTMQRLRVCINNLPDIWQGAAADEFIQKFASANNQFNSFSDTLEMIYELTYIVQVKGRDMKLANLPVIT